MDWSDGYVVDTEYNVGFFRKQAPSYLSIVCIMNGYEPVPVDRPFTYFELGCGHGFTANILAASNPQGHFYAADFLPSHIATGQQLAGDARLDNLTLLENSFAELAAGKVDVPPLDFISLHGVYTWVSPENRRHIVDFIARYLKPGGIVYVTYNALPGWSPAAPLQRLVLEHADAHPNSRDVQVEQARSLIGKLIDTKAAYFTVNAQTILQHRLESWKTENPTYLAHEYMNRCWQPLYHADVAREFAVAKADYVGSVELGFAFPKMCLTEAQRDVLATVPGAAWRETLKDYMLNTAFRGDVFVRGARRMSDARRTQWLQRLGLALTVPRDVATLGFTSENLTAQADLVGPLLDRLAKSPQPLSDLVTLHGQTMERLTQLLAMMNFHNEGQPYFLSSATGSTAAAHHMNDAVARQSLLDDRYQALASPLLGNGVSAGLMQRLVYRSLTPMPERIDAMRIARQVWQAMKDQGCAILDAGKPQGTPDDEMAEVHQTVKKILEVRLPIWRQLQVL